jgi:hypothetical protein
MRYVRGMDKLMPPTAEQSGAVGGQLERLVRRLPQLASGSSSPMEF